jgi:methylamine dehydrogenase accessory protein MauD
VGGLWLASYLVLWGLVIVMCLVLLGVLKQLGTLHLRYEHPVTPAGEGVPALEKDGPAIGSRLSDFPYATVNGFGSVTPISLLSHGRVLLMFLSPMCESCQHVVEPLNALVEDRDRAVQGMAIIRADEQACRAFLSVFPLRMPTVCDADRTITMGYGVHRTPFGLLYDERGNLIRKGLVEGKEDLLALLGDVSASTKAQSHVFPQLEPSHTEELVGSSRH